MSEFGLLRAGEVVILSGPALKAALESALIAIRHRKTVRRSDPSPTRLWPANCRGDGS